MAAARPMATSNAEAFEQPDLIPGNPGDLIGRLRRDARALVHGVRDRRGKRDAQESVNMIEERRSLMESRACVMPGRLVKASLIVAEVVPALLNPARRADHAPVQELRESA